MPIDGKPRHLLGALDVDKTALFLCDVQEKFRPAMIHFSEIVQSTKKVILGCKALDIPLLVTEQYPKGLGPTVEDLPIEHAEVVAAKTKFSMAVPEIQEHMVSICDGDLQSVLLCGIETHVCVEQTAIDLIDQGLVVHILADCCTSRSQENRALALQRLQQIGCFITTSECVLFKLLGDKNNPKFKEVAAILKDQVLPTGLYSRI